MSVNPFVTVEKPLHERLREAADTLELAYGQQRVVVDPTDLRERAGKEEAKSKKSELVEELASAFRAAFVKTGPQPRHHDGRPHQPIPYARIPEKAKDRYRQIAKEVLGGFDVRRKDDLW